MSYYLKPLGLLQNFHHIHSLILFMSSFDITKVHHPIKSTKSTTPTIN